MGGGRVSFEVGTCSVEVRVGREGARDMVRRDRLHVDNNCNDILKGGRAFTPLISVTLVETLLYEPAVASAELSVNGIPMLGCGRSKRRVKKLNKAGPIYRIFFRCAGLYNMRRDETRR